MTIKGYPNLTSLQTWEFTTCCCWILPFNFSNFYHKLSIFGDFFQRWRFEALDLNKSLSSVIVSTSFSECFKKNWYAWCGFKNFYISRFSFLLTPNQNKQKRQTNQNSRHVSSLLFKSSRALNFSSRSFSEEPFEGDRGDSRRRLALGGPWREKGATGKNIRIEYLRIWEHKWVSSIEPIITSQLNTNESQLQR